VIGPWLDRVGQRVVVRHRLPDGSATDVVGELLRADPDAGALVVAGRHGEVTVPVAAVLAGKVVPPRPARPAPPHLALDVGDQQRVMASHWLPRDHERLGDWLLRAAGGFTNRGNSVLVTGSPGMPPAAAVEHVTRWYAARGLPPRAALPSPLPPRDADEHAVRGENGRAFAAAGWRPIPGVGALVLTAATRPLAAGTAATDLPDGLALDLADVPDEQWRALYRYRGQQLPPSALELLLSAPERTFVSIRAGTRTVAVGRGSLAHAWLGVTAVEVAPDARRQGLARAVLAALARWADARGARSTYLQVADGNEAARQLYLSAGFAVHHRYDYLEAGPGTGTG
jgi:GNAT superfamily N-acetyltransferase